MLRERRFIRTRAAVESCVSMAPQFGQDGRNPPHPDDSSSASMSSSMESRLNLEREVHGEGAFVRFVTGFVPPLKSTLPLSGASQLRSPPVSGFSGRSTQPIPPFRTSRLPSVSTPAAVPLPSSQFRSRFPPRFLPRVSMPPLAPAFSNPPLHPIPISVPLDHTTRPPPRPPRQPHPRPRPRPRPHQHEHPFYGAPTPTPSSTPTLLTSPLSLSLRPPDPDPGPTPNSDQVQFDDGLPPHLRPSSPSLCSEIGIGEGEGESEGLDENEKCEIVGIPTGYVSVLMCGSARSSSSRRDEFGSLNEYFRRFPVSQVRQKQFFVHRILAIARQKPEPGFPRYHSMNHPPSSGGSSGGETNLRFREFFSNPGNVVLLLNVGRGHQLTQFYLPHCVSSMRLLHVPMGVDGPQWQVVEEDKKIGRDLIVMVRADEVGRIQPREVILCEDAPSLSALGTRGGIFVRPSIASTQDVPFYYDLNSTEIRLGRLQNQRIAFDHGQVDPRRSPPVESSFIQFRYQLKYLSSRKRRNRLYRVRIQLRVRETTRVQDAVTDGQDQQNVPQLQSRILSSVETFFFMKKDNQRLDRFDTKIPYEFVFLPNSNPTRRLNPLLGETHQREEENENE